MCRYTTCLSPLERQIRSNDTFIAINKPASRI